MRCNGRCVRRRLARDGLTYTELVEQARFQAATRLLEDTEAKITDIAFELVPPTFTIPELRAVHEVVKGVVYDPGNFRRRFQRMMTDGIIEEAPGKRVTVSKPARVAVTVMTTKGIASVVCAMIMPG